MPVKFHFKRQPDFNDPSKQLETIPPLEVATDRTLVPVPANDARSSDADDDVDDYEVGYGKPPVEHQFKKGNAGGPGRPKRSKNRKTMFLEEADRYLLNKVDGVRLTKCQAGYRQLATKGAKGDLRAIELSEKLRDKLCGPDPETLPIEPPLSDAELEALRRLQDE